MDVTDGVHGLNAITTSDGMQAKKQDEVDHMNCSLDAPQI